ncbi:hypothetical protein COCNU_01G004440 [Cocos nucifera]|uniref:Uncharacterized protein n=1 Tax=Cocos nucifera TaxID=13894 RepID=A0A8K0HUP4_COCNU|nr:hypothetical protein COCNU_01G004440 [Cocos nucifera]
MMMASSSSFWACAVSPVSSAAAAASSSVLPIKPRTIVRETRRSGNFCLSHQLCFHLANSRDQFFESGLLLEMILDNDVAGCPIGCWCRSYAQCYFTFAYIIKLDESVNWLSGIVCWVLDTSDPGTMLSLNDTGTSRKGKLKLEIVFAHFDIPPVIEFGLDQLEECGSFFMSQRRRQAEAINGAWAMIGLTAGLVVEGRTGKGILGQLAGYSSAMISFFIR